MNFRLIYIALFLTISASKAFSQNAVESLTQSLVDSSMSKNEKATIFYNWVTNNIKYDLAALKNWEISYSQSPEETIKKGRGLCNKYAELYETMCSYAGIEAYTINGYNKGYQFNDQKPFFKSNHAWNVIYVDSTWKHIDCTWGSGYLVQKPGALKKVLYNIVKTSYTNNKISYTSDPNPNYFDIPIDTLITTHYPADPKWLLSDSPISYEYFISDTSDKYCDYFNFEQEIEEVRHKSTILQKTNEGTNALKYNPLNHYDLASAFSNKSATYNLERDISEANKYQFEQYINEYTIIQNSANKYLHLSDSIYRLRKSNLKQVGRDQRRLTGKINSKAKKAQKTHKSSQKKIVGKSSSYYKKISGFQINIGRTELKKASLVNHSRIEYTDTAQYLELFSNIEQLNAPNPDLYNILDSLMYVVDDFAKQDAQIDDSIAVANTLFRTNIDVLFENLLATDEKSIVGYVDSLNLVYKDILSFLDDKKAAKSDLQNTGRAYYSTSSLLQKNLKSELNNIIKLGRLSNNADSIINLQNEVVDELIQCYESAILFTKKLARHNESQTDIRQANLKALKDQKKSINRENKFFVSWYEATLEYDKKEYTYFKEQAKLMRTNAVRGQKSVSLKLQRFNADKSN